MYVFKAHYLSFFLGPFKALWNMLDHPLNKFAALTTVTQHLMNSWYTASCIYVWECIQRIKWPTPKKTVSVPFFFAVFGPNNLPSSLNKQMKLSLLKCSFSVCMLLLRQSLSPSSAFHLLRGLGAPRNLKAILPHWFLLVKIIVNIAIALRIQKSTFNVTQWNFATWCCVAGRGGIGKRGAWWYSQKLSHNTKVKILFHADVGCQDAYAWRPNACHADWYVRMCESECGCARVCVMSLLSIHPPVLDDGKTALSTNHFYGCLMRFGVYTNLMSFSPAFEQGIASWVVSVRGRTT